MSAGVWLCSSIDLQVSRLREARFEASQSQNGMLQVGRPTSEQDTPSVRRFVCKGVMINIKADFPFST